MNGNNKIVDLIRDTIYEIDAYIEKNKQKDKIIQKNLSDLEKEKTKLADNIKQLDPDSKLSNDDILLSLVYFYVAKFIIARRKDTPQSSSFLKGFLDYLKKNHENYAPYIHIQNTMKIFGKMDVPSGILASSGFTESLKSLSKQAGEKEETRFQIENLFETVRDQSKPINQREMILYATAQKSVYDWLKYYGE